MRDKSPRRVLAATAIGNFGEIYDFAVFGFSVPVLSAHFFPGSDPLAATLSTFAAYAVAFFARPLGGLLFGIMTDKIGRIRILSATVMLMAGGTAAIGLLPSYASIGIAAPIALVLCRIVQGLAMGGETTGSSAYILETAPLDQRGRWQGIIWFWSFCPNAFTALFVLAVQATAGMPAYHAWAWRVPFLAGALVGPVGYWLRRNLDDPTEYKQAVRETEITNTLGEATRSSFRSMRQVVVIQITLAIGAYMLLGFMYTFIVQRVHLSSLTALMTNAFAIVLLAAFIALMGAASDRFGRKPILTIGAGWVAVGAYPAFYLLASRSLLGAIAGQVLLAIGIGIYSGAAFVVMPELFPTAIRGTGHAVSYQFAVALFGGTTPFIATWLVGAFNSPLAPGVYLALASVIGLVLIQFVPETRWLDLRTSVQADRSEWSGEKRGAE